MRPARRTALKNGAGAGVRTSAPVRRTHTPHGVGTYHTAKSKRRSGATWQAKSMSEAALARTSIMSSTGVVTRVHPSALARESSPREMASETLDSEGTRWKSGAHCRSDARPQKEARMPLTEGSFP